VEQLERIIETSLSPKHKSLLGKRLFYSPSMAVPIISLKIIEDNGNVIKKLLSEKDQVKESQIQEIEKRKIKILAWEARKRSIENISSKGNSNRER
jgi:hypothetical protein